MPESRLIVQALKAFGEGRITPKAITQIRRQFDSALRQRILLDTKTATGWVYAAVQEIAKDVREWINSRGCSAEVGEISFLRPLPNSASGRQSSRRTSGSALVLKLLFQKSRFKIPGLQRRHVAFEGHRLIERFSEDIDLVLDWKLIGFGEGLRIRCRSSFKVKQDSSTKK